MNCLNRIVGWVIAVTTAMSASACAGGLPDTILIGQVIYDRTGHDDWDSDWPLTVIFTDDSGFNQRRVVRRGFFAIPIPSGRAYKVYLQGSSTVIPIGKETVRDELDWTGPTWLTAPPGTHSSVLRELPLNLARRGEGTNLHHLIGAGFEPLPPELAADLETINQLATEAPDVGRDSVLWSLTYLRAKYLDNREALSAVAATEIRLRRDPRTESLFGGEGKARYAAFRMINAARFGRGAPVPPTDLQKIFVDPQMFITAQDEALRLHAASGMALSDSGWTTARKLAEDGSSPLVYSANLACAKSPTPEHQKVVLTGIDSDDPWRYEASLNAASKADLPEAKAKVMQRARALPEYPAMKKATIQFLGRQKDTDSLHAIARFLGDSSLEVTLSARNELKKKGPASLPRIILDAMTRLDDRKLNSVEPRDLNRINTLRRGPGRFQP